MKQLGFWRLAVAAPLLATILITIFAVPGNMDEHSIYHAIACRHFPMARYNVGFSDDCASFGLWLNGTKFWDRAFYYMGLAHNFLYYPVYLLIPSHYSAQIFGLILYALSVWGAARLLAIPLWCSLAAFGASYGLTYLFLRDGGVVAPHMLAALWIPLLARYALNATTTMRYVVRSVVLALAIFLAFEAKPSFMYALPGILIITLSAFPEWIPGRGRFLKVARRLAPALLAAAVLCAALISLSTSPHEYRSYASDLISHYPIRGDGPPMDERLERGLRCSLNPVSTLAYINRITGETCLTPQPFKTIPEGVPVALSHLSLALIFATIALCAWRHAHLRMRLAALAGGGFLTVLLVSTHPFSEQAHHYPLAWLMWALAFALSLHALRPRLACAAALSGGTLAAMLALCSLFLKLSIYSGWERMQVLRKLDEPRIASHAMIIHPTWGLYFTSSLYGPREQMEMQHRGFLWSAQAQQRVLLDEWESLARKEHRRLLFVAQRGSRLADVLPRLRPDMIRLYPPDGMTNDWAVWGSRDWLAEADWSE